jgi:hypothetical protein
MHEAFRRRLEALEEACKLQDGEPHMLSVGFCNVEATVAWTGNFKCWRLAGEDEDPPWRGLIPNAAPPIRARFKF